MTTPALTVIIPAYNEEKRLGFNLDQVLKYLHKNFPEFELIIVDDGSTDNMAKVVAKIIVNDSRAKLTRINQTVVRAMRLGLALRYQQGTEYCLWMQIYPRR